MSPAVGIAAILKRPEFAFRGGPNNWVLQISSMGSQDNVICVYDSAGRTPEVGVAIDYPGIQVMGRGTKGDSSYATLYSKMQDVFNILQAIPQNPPEYPELTSCVVRSGIASLGKDDNDRPLLSLNFNLITTPNNLGNREQI